MYFFLSIFISIICALLSYISLDEVSVNKITLINFFSENKDIESKKVDKYQRIIFSIGIGVISFGTSIKILTDVSDGINVCKMMTLLICLIGTACIDYREHRIPNIFPIILILMGIICLVSGIITNQNGAISYVVSSVFATVGCGVCLTVASILTKQGIGFGDIKLLCGVAFVGGVYVFCGTLFFGVFLSAFFALILLLVKKKKLKESIPFGPFICVGYIITVFMSFY